MTDISPKLITLNHLALLQVHGADARKFLQGQLTCDTTRADGWHLTHGAHCTPKGRMRANFDLLATDDQTLYLRTSAGAALQASLQRYIVFAKSDIIDLSGNYRLLGVMAADVAPLAQQLGLSDDAPCSSRDGAVYCLLDSQRIECWIPAASALPPCLENLECSDDPRPWQVRDIELGRGWVVQESVDSFLPQALNLQLPAIDGISFKKGCYTGQEIVARMHYKGKLKRHMYRFSAAPAATELPAGTPLFQSGASQAVGEVVNSVLIEDRLTLLAVVTEEAADANNVQTGANPPLVLERQPLPYAITA